MIDVKTAATSELIAFYNANSGRPVIKKFADRATAEKRVMLIIQTMAKVAKMAEPEASKTDGVAKKPRRSRWDNKTIKLLVPANPRREGTNAWLKFDRLVRYLADNPLPTVQQVFDNTNYRSNDLLWDLERKFVELQEVK